MADIANEQYPQRAAGDRRVEVVLAVFFEDCARRHVQYPVARFDREHALPRNDDPLGASAVVTGCMTR